MNASSRIMYETALRMGIECFVFEDGETILMKKDGKSWYTRGSRTSLQSSVGKSIADKKHLTKSVLHYFKLPTAKSVLIENEADLEKISTLSFPVVMKPLEERHGVGVMVGLRNIEELKKSYTSQDYTSVLAEETLTGTEYRIVCIDFKFAAAAFRKPAHVLGDGEHTIEELVTEKNKHPWRGKGHEHNLTLIEIDDTVIKNLAEQELTPQSIPAKNQEVVLRKTANLSTGGEAWDVTDEVCPENRELFERIAKACDLNVIGIDMMCQDLSTPIEGQNKAGVIEVNASPGLRMHHYPIQGSPQPLAEKILQSVLERHTL
jgi:cyanophycin synthetase